MNTIANEADMPHNCPHCEISLLGEEIPDESKPFYAGNFFKKEIGVEIPELYDGDWYYRCPECGGEWGGVRGLK